MKEFLSFVTLISTMSLISMSCSFLGLTPELNVEVNNPKIERQIVEQINLHPFAIWQGLTTATTTEIKVLAKKSKELSFKILDHETEVKSVKSLKTMAGKTDYIVYSFFITNLNINTNYTFQVIQELQIIDQRNFQTVDIYSEKATIGIVSCIHDKFRNAQFSIWNEYLNLNPTYTFMIGDNVYADTLLSNQGKVFAFKHANEDMLWKRYVETFNLLSYYKSARLVPTLAVWDDHDYGFNNGDRSYPFKKESLKVFQTFYGFQEIPKITTQLSGVGYVFEAFQQRFVFMDGRSFRTEPKFLGQKTESHLGEDQKQEILRIMSNAKPTWLIKGDQFFGGYHKFESYETNHPADFKSFLSELKNSKSKAFFVSGDRHLNELMQIKPEDLGYETYELTSSAIHASIFPDAWKKNPNPRQIKGASGTYNYSVIELNKINPWFMRVTSYGPKMKVLYDQDLDFKSGLRKGTQK